MVTGLKDSELKDSGERREFKTGAVRDRAVGKGLPSLLSAPFMKDIIDEISIGDDYVKDALSGMYGILFDKDWKQALEVASSLITIKGFAIAIRRLSVQIEKGAIKYSKRNWEKGMPLEEYCNSAIRHILAMIAGEDDEDHYAAALFNVMALYHTGYMISKNKLPKELNNLPGGAGYAI